MKKTILILILALIAGGVWGFLAGTSVYFHDNMESKKERGNTIGYIKNDVLAETGSINTSTGEEITLPDVAVTNNKPIKIITNEDDYHLDGILKEFEQATGVKTEVSFSEDDVKGRLANREEGDLIYNKISSELVDISNDERTKDLVSPITDKSLNNVDNKYKDIKDGKWFNLSYRLRSFYVKKGVTDFPKNYEELSDSKYKGKICIRPLSHTYNVQLIAYMIAKHGEDYTRTWLKGLKDNLAIEASGNDRAQIGNIYAGKCDIAIANSYYMALMLADKEQRNWARNVNLFFPNQDNEGALALYNGISVTKNGSENPLVNKLIDFILSPLGQQYLSASNYEYPVIGEANSEMIKSFGDFQNLKPTDIKVDTTITQSDVAAHREDALLMVKELETK